MSADDVSHARRHPSRIGRRVILLALIGAVGLALLMNGSVAAPWRQLAFLVVAATLLPMLAIGQDRPDARKLWRWTIVGTAMLLGWVALQVTPLPGGLLANPVWDEVAALGIEARPMISIAPTATLAALPALILPLLVFAAMILLCQERREALLAWKALAVLGMALAALSAALELVFPQTTFFSDFTVGRGAFNGIFVNRNTTAAFLGLAGFAVAGWIMLPRAAPRHVIVGDMSAPRIAWGRVLLVAALFMLLIALISTRSRAGATLALIFLSLAFALLFVFWPERSGPHGHAGPVPLGRSAKAVLALAVGATLFVVYGDPVYSRMGAEAEISRWCVAASTLEMIRERPIQGYGFGTFADAFPQYRNPDCMSTSGAWTRAHNSHLEFLAGAGLVGGLIALAMMGAMLRVLVVGFRKRRSLRAIPIMTLGALGFVLAHSVVDFPLQVPGVALYFAALMGTGCAVAGLISTPVTRRRRSVRRPEIQ